MVKELQTLSEAARRGDLAWRADDTQFQGVFGEVIRGINGTIDRIVAVLEALAEGDLTGRVRGSYEGDHAKLVDSLHGAIDQMNETILHIGRSAEVLGHASAELSTTAESLGVSAADAAERVGSASAGAGEVSANTQSAATATEELSASISKPRGPVTPERASASSRRR